MTKAIVVALPAMGMALALSGAAPARLRIGDAMPDLTLPRSQGAPLHLRQLRGQVLIINFFASYCGPCREELPLLLQLVTDLNRVRQPGQPSVALLPIGIDAKPDVSARFAAALGVTQPILLDADGQARTAFDPQRYPCTFLIDAQGLVRHINRGFGPGYRDRIGRWLRTMLTSAPP